MKRLVLGAVAGCIATIPMTWTMEKLNRRLPRKERMNSTPRDTHLVQHEQSLSHDQFIEKVGSKEKQ